MPAQASQSIAPDDPFIKELLEAFDRVFGLHPGFRPVHAKGLMCTGTFTPAAEAQKSDAGAARCQAIGAGGGAVVGFCRGAEHSR